MYGTIMRLQVQPGQMEALMAWGSSGEGNSIPGYLKEYLFEMESDANDLYLVLIFTDKASYDAYIQSARRQLRMAEMRTMLAADPVYHDGPLIYTNAVTADGS